MLIAINIIAAAFVVVAMVGLFSHAIRRDRELHTVR